MYEENEMEQTKQQTLQKMKSDGYPFVYCNFKYFLHINKKTQWTAMTELAGNCRVKQKVKFQTLFARIWNQRIGKPQFNCCQSTIELPFSFNNIEVNFPILFFSSVFFGTKHKDKDMSAPQTTYQVEKNQTWVFNDLKANAPFTYKRNLSLLCFLNQPIQSFDF